MPIKGDIILPKGAKLVRNEADSVELPKGAKLVRSDVGAAPDPEQAPAEVKKKESIFGGEAGAVENFVRSKTGTSDTDPSSSSSEAKDPVVTTGFDKSFLDHDIDKQFDLSLSNPAFTKPKDKYSLSNFYNQEAQARFDERKESTRAEIKSSPDSLAKYNADRISQINDDLKQDEDSVKGLMIASAYGAKGLEELTAEQRENIAVATAYKNRLKAAVASEAVKSVVPKYVAPGANFDARAMGRELLSVADPELELQYKEAEKNGDALPSIQMANMERMGIDAAKSYLSSLPQDDNVKERLAEVKKFEDDFDERNPALTEQRVREKLGAQLYREGKSGFWGYSHKTLEDAINNPETGLSDVEKKYALSSVLAKEDRLIFSTDIPGSGFFRAGKNEITRSVQSLTNVVADKIGERTDQDRAYDNLNDEIGGSQFRAPGENPSLKAELKHLQSLEDKGEITESDKKRKADLEKYVDVRTKWHGIRDGIGGLTGQVMEFAFLTKGVGAIGKGLSAIGKSGGLLTGGMTSSAVGAALSNETVGLFLTGYLNSIDNYKSQALQLMPGDSNAANRDAYAKTMAFFEGATEQVFRDTKILSAVTKGAAPSIANITSRLINREITEQVAREEMRTAIVKYAKPFAKEFATSTAQESTEEALVDWADGIGQSLFGGKPFDVVETGRKAVNTFLTTAIHSPLVAGMAAHGGARRNKSERAFYKAAITDMGVNPAPYLASIEELRLNGTITQGEANDKIFLVNSASKYFKEVPEAVVSKIKTPEGDKRTERKMDYPEVSSYMVHRMNEGVLARQLEHTEDPVVQRQLQERISRSEKIRTGIAEGWIGVTPDMNEVTDDPKVAMDLGISNVANVPASELVGTPFQTHELAPSEAAVITALQENEELAAGVEGTMSKLLSEAVKDPKNHREIIDMLVDQSIDEPALQSIVGPAVMSAVKALNKQSKYKTTTDLVGNPEEISPTIELKPFDTSAGAAPTSVVMPEQNRAPVIIPLKKAQPAYDKVQDEIVDLNEKIEGEGGLNEQIEQAENEGNESRVENLKMQRRDIYAKMMTAFNRGQQLSDPSLDPETTNVEELLEKEPTERKLEPEESKKFSKILLDFADSILKADITGAGGSSAMSNIFKVPQYIIGNAVKAVGLAVQGGEQLASAIKKGLAHLKEYNVDETEFTGYINSLLAGQKPRVRVPLQGQPAPTQPTQQQAAGASTAKVGPPDALAAFKMRTSGDLETFMTEGTFQNIFGDPQSGEQYEVQRLSEMLDDGLNMLGIAQVMFGSMDVYDYGPKLLKYAQSMSNDVAAGNKKAVLLATFLGEMKEEMERDPMLADRIRPLYNSTFDYYKRVMNKAGKDLAAGRLLRLFRDKYMADIFQNRILDDGQAQQLQTTMQAESRTEISDADLQAYYDAQKAKMREDIEREIAEEKARLKSERKQNTQRKVSDKERYAAAAAQKQKAVETKYGGVKSLSQTIIDKLKNLNCK
jgi:hypothetical protein